MEPKQTEDAAAPTTNGPDAAAASLADEARARAVAESQCAELRETVAEMQTECLELSKALALSRKAQKQLQAQLVAAEKRIAAAEGVA